MRGCSRGFSRWGCGWPGLGSQRLGGHKGRRRGAYCPRDTYAALAILHLDFAEIGHVQHFGKIAHQLDVDLHCAPFILVSHAISSLENRFVAQAPRSEEHTSELQSRMRISYAAFCL